MTDYLNKKEFGKIFAPLQTKTHIRVLKRVDKLPVLLIHTVLRLAALDFIKYILVSDNEIKTSNETKEKRLKIPITEEGHLTATGICIVYHLDYNIIDFDEINSPMKGNGQKMVECVLKDFPNDWQAGIFMDWSGGFWDKMKEKYPTINWMDY
ncbi:MAG: hypothetical protein ABI325_02165 [Ginsengibacter sp.]